MRILSHRNRLWGIAAIVSLAWLLTSSLTVDTALGGERRFLVILASSPKQFPDGGQPAGGFPNRTLIDRQYFDDVAGNGIDSFAEYWEEISYGDVTISGKTVGWLELPWAIQPPLASPQRHTAGTAPPVQDVLEDPALRLTPDNFFDMNADGFYEYGISERFNNGLAMAIVDTDGDPGSIDNGPSFVGEGSRDFSQGGLNAGNPVWMPGERYIDVDEDGKWDGLDEVNNWMDWDGDSRPDLAGPWVDLNGDNQASVSGTCDCALGSSNGCYLADSDNDSGFDRDNNMLIDKPDCCPEGPGQPGCEGFPASGACPPTTWSDQGGNTITDCNGNLIDDAIDIQEFIDSGGTRGSPDRSPVSASTDACDVFTVDGIPDECQVVNFNTECRDPGDLDVDDPCLQRAECIALDPLRTPLDRCEFSDPIALGGNNDGDLDIVEPFENFLRRWDPCFMDPDVSPPNANEQRAHWIKVFDPFSPSAGTTMLCDGDSVDYADPAYILNNYPGDPRKVIQQAVGRPVYGQHDPLRTLPPVCTDGDDDRQGQICERDSDCCTGNTNCPAGSCRKNCVCEVDVFGVPGGPCTNLDLDESGDLDPTEINLCLAGWHNEFDPPDSWDNVTDDSVGRTGPGGVSRFTTKMQEVGGLDGSAVFVTVTPEPGTLVNGRQFDQPWYQQAWSDRYNGVCHNDPANPSVETPCCFDRGHFDDLGIWVNQGDPATCDPPPWPVANGMNSPLVVPFDDVDDNTYDANPTGVTSDRRYFRANWGGLNGDGTGWDGNDNLQLQWETGPLGTEGFEQNMDRPILPEEANGTSQAAIFFDGFVEYDDLPSSKYHTAGDEWLGEITSPFRSFYLASNTGIVISEDISRFDPTSATDGLISVPAIWGEDRGQHDPNRPRMRDGITPAAGPYAINIHGSLGRDGGNLLLMELLTRRTDGQFLNSGRVWESIHGNYHPYAGPGRFGVRNENLGFRDYNLDGLIDQGEVRPAASGNYIVDSYPTTANNGFSTVYPWNRRRLVEDCIEVLDDGGVDFDEFVDAVAMDAFTCGQGPLLASLPAQFLSGSFATSPDELAIASGVASSIVLLPPGSTNTARGTFNISGRYFPIHNQDGLGDPRFESSNFPRVTNPTPENKPQISWNIQFNDLVADLSRDGVASTVASSDFLTAFAAHEYLHTWERFPDLYDYDVFEPPGPEINCPIGAWGIMASGGKVHPVPILKEKPCTEWIEPIDLTTILTPGVDKLLTLPPAEFTRDNSYFFIENEARFVSAFNDRFIERFYFWSAGSGFDTRMPGDGGLLIMHTDTSANPEAQPPQQRIASHFTYYIVQADGLDQLTSCEGRAQQTSVGDAGDLWPGTANMTEFSCSSFPASRWYAGDACTGLTVSDIRADGAGSMQVTMNWVPTDVPSLRFIDPPGGVSVSNPPQVIYQVRAAATDLFGGTWIRLFHTDDETDLSVDPDGANFIGMIRKATPGTMEISSDWDLTSIPDGQYFIFADLIPGPGSDNDEQSVNRPRPGRNNVGTGSVNISQSDVDTNEIIASGERGRLLGTQAFDATTDVGGAIDFTAVGVQVGDQIVVGGFTDRLQRLRTIINISGNGQRLTLSSGMAGVGASVRPWQITRDTGKARSETWSLKCISADGTQWRVFSSLTQPEPLDEFEVPDPDTLAITGQRYTSRNGAVRFEITAGSQPFTLGDTFTFTTTGVTALSSGVSVLNTRISENPTAVILALPLAGDPPLTVEFDGRNSSDPNDEALAFRWEFGDGSPPAFGSNQTHTFTLARTFSVVLRVTNARTGLFDETAVDIAVTNNSPNAVLMATPTSGRAPLLVTFDGTNSSDPESSDPETLVYQWDYGDGVSANNAGLPGSAFATRTHFYDKRADGSSCLPREVCEFIATLTVTDEGGKQDTDTKTIVVGNSSPIVNITHSSLQGSDPHEVVFNAIGSSDPDGDPICVEWVWGDNTPDECWPLSGANGSTNGSVPHQYVLPDGANSGSFETFATLRDYPDGLNGPCDCSSALAGSEVRWAGATVVINASATEASDPRARFDMTPFPPQLNEAFTVDAGLSRDFPIGGIITSYTWSWGDGSNPDTFTVPTATHTYTAAGTYTVSLTVADGETPPNTNTTTKTFTVLGAGAIGDDNTENQRPTAVVRVDRQQGSPGDVFRFDASNSSDPDTGDELTYMWNFDDGQRTNAAGVAGDAFKIVTHSFSAPGTYSVKLTVRDDRFGFDETTVDIFVVGEGGNFAPKAIIATGPRSAIAPAQLTFDARASFDPDEDPLSFSWRVLLNGGSLSPGTLPVNQSTLNWTFTLEGTYTVELTVVDGRGSSDTVSVEVKIGPSAATTTGPTDVPVPNPTPSGDARDSAANRPAGICGLGMVMSLFGSLLGLSAMMATRRWTRS